MRISDWSSDGCSAGLGLLATLLFDLAPGEYLSNVVLAVLSGRAALGWPGGFADQAAVEAIAGLYAPHVAMLSPAEHAAFAGNAISASPGTAWMSAGAASALSVASREMLDNAGFSLRPVPLDAVEAAGGSLRCCVAEIY